MGCVASPSVLHAAGYEYAAPPVTDCCTGLVTASYYQQSCGLTKPCTQGIHIIKDTTSVPLQAASRRLVCPQETNMGSDPRKQQQSRNWQPAQADAQVLEVYVE